MNLNFRKIVFLWMLLFVISGLFAKEINGKSYLKSLLLPGFGEISSGHKSGYVFIASELLIWSSRWYLNNEQNLKDKQSYLKALKSAHINPDIDFNEDYILKLKNYMSSGFEAGGYNEEVLHKAITLYPDDKRKQDEYINENMIPDNLGWKWDSKQDKHDYSILRKRILQYSNYLKINLGLFFINRLASVIHLVGIEKSMKLDVSLNENFDTVILLKYKF